MFMIYELCIDPLLSYMKKIKRNMHTHIHSMILLLYRFPGICVPNLCATYRWFLISI